MSSVADEMLRTVSPIDSYRQRIDSHWQRKMRDRPIYSRKFPASRPNAGRGQRRAASVAHFAGAPPRPLVENPWHSAVSTVAADDQSDAFWPGWRRGIH